MQNMRDKQAKQNTFDTPDSKPGTANADGLKVEVRGLKKYFGSVRAVDGLDFTITGGKVHGFIGPNGAGKTTTMRIMATIDSPDEGDVLLNGRSLLQFPDLLRRVIGFMPDFLDTYTDMIVEEYIDFYARAYRLSPALRKKRIAEIIEFTGLGPLLEQTVNALSKGEKQRLGLSRVLINDPDLLILDEPAAGLDPRARVEFRNLVRQLADNGKAVFISSHILTELSEVCDEVTIIDKGKICASDSVDNLQNNTSPGTRVLVSTVDPTKESIARLVKHLAEIPGVVTAEKAIKGAAFSYEGPPSTRNAILSNLIKNNFDLTDFYASSTDLEEAFMSLTEKKNEERKKRSD
ncbi:MAG: ABC transporter ATP-binding protein [bacterium]|nr:ABC transporter ATP-binding protein [bacterium]